MACASLFLGLGFFLVLVWVLVFFCGERALNYKVLTIPVFAVKEHNIVIHVL